MNNPAQYAQDLVTNLGWKRANKLALHYHQYMQARTPWISEWPNYHEVKAFWKHVYNYVARRDPKK